MHAEKSGFNKTTPTTNENGSQKIEFVDKRGNVVLKKVQLGATVDDGSGAGHSGWLCTYYLYCDYGHLHCVIQPNGVDILSTNGSTAGPWMPSTAILNELCFRYEYDDKDRVIMKKNPGAITQGLVYDKRGRLVMKQDGNLSAVATNRKWVVTLYDQLDRPILSGLWSSNATRSSHQTNANTS
ncbi:MAG: hypothetical protein EOO88_52265, partial [Pedobacter sp.]